MLCSTPETRPILLAQFQQKTEEAQSHHSLLWQKLGQTMLYLGLAMVMLTVLALAFTGFGIIPAIGIGVGIASSAASMGFFACNRPQGLAKATFELEANIQ